MQTNKKLIEQKIYEKWMPKIEARFKEKGIKVSDTKMKKIAKLAHTRKLYENALSLGQVHGRGAFSFGNDPSNGSDFSKGSGEVFQNLFGIFLDATATTYGMDLLPILTMTKSNINVFITEPVIGGGKIDSADAKPLAFMVKQTAVGTPTVLVKGTTYTVTEGNAGDSVIDLVYIGNDRLHGYFMFKVGQQYDNTGGGGVNYLTKTIAECLTFTGNNNGIYQSGVNYYRFDETKVDYINTYLNFVSGFTGAGKNDTDAWGANRNDGKSLVQPMSRETGEKTFYRQMALRNWSKNFSADTYHASIEYTTEQIQDMKMDHDVDALEVGDSALQDSLSQSINDHILSFISAYGWQNHYDMNQANGFNMNTHIATTTGASTSYVGSDGVLKTIAGAVGVLPSSGAISENLSSIQRRLITRMTYGSAVVNTRCRKGRGDTASMNGTFTTAVRDVRGYTPASFENNINDSGLHLIGDFNGIAVYEDGLADLLDERISVFRKGTDNDTGLKMCTYLLAEKISAINTSTQGTLAPIEALKSRYAIVGAGSNPQLNYMTFAVSNSSGYKLV